MGAKKLGMPDVAAVMDIELTADKDSALITVGRKVGVHYYYVVIFTLLQSFFFVVLRDRCAVCPSLISVLSGSTPCPIHSLSGN